MKKNEKSIEKSWPFEKKLIIWVENWTRGGRSCRKGGKVCLLGHKLIISSTKNRHEIIVKPLLPCKPYWLSVCRDASSC